MIGGLQGEFGDLDIKYLKQNIPKYLKMSVGNISRCWSEISGSFRRTPRHCATFCLQLGVILVSAMEDPDMADRES